VLLNSQQRSTFDETVTATITVDTMCNLPVKFLHDIFRKIGLIRGSIIRLVLNTHLPSSAGYSCTVAGASVYTNSASQSPYGFQPIQLGMGGSVAGVLTPQLGAGMTSFVARATIGNTQSSVCQIRVPMITLSPQAEDRYLKQPVKEVFYEDFLSNPALKNVASGTATMNWLVTSGQSRLRRMIIVPQVSGNATAGVGNGTDGVSAINSPLSSAGATSCSPYYGFTALNVALSGQNIWQQNLDYKWQQWLLETAYAQSINGGFDPALVTTSLSEADYASLHSYCEICLSRHTASDDEVAKSVALSFTNSSTRMQDFFIFLCYERQLKIDKGTGQLVV
jgi:hypothetical protein